MSQTPVISAKDLAAEVQAFETQGFVVFESVFDDATVTNWHHHREHLVSTYQYLTGSAEVPDAIGGLLERVPEVALPVVTHPALLGFAEAVIGPMVQLDSVVLAGDPSLDASWFDKPVSWHRDRFGYLPIGDTYRRPSSIVMISYMQEMTRTVGPLRVIPGSHIDGTALTKLTERHPEERLIAMNPGSVVAIHHNLLHSATRNVAAAERRFLGWIYNVSAYMHEDNFEGPNCRLVRDRAVRERNRRLMRLLGDDDQIFPRQNSGFTGPEESNWERWLKEDEEFAQIDQTNDGAEFASEDRGFH